MLGEIIYHGWESDGVVYSKLQRSVCSPVNVAQSPL